MQLPQPSSLQTLAVERGHTSWSWRWQWWWRPGSNTEGVTKPHITEDWKGCTWFMEQLFSFCIAQRETCSCSWMLGLSTHGNSNSALSLDQASPPWVDECPLSYDQAGKGLGWHHAVHNHLTYISCVEIEAQKSVNQKGENYGNDRNEDGEATI